MTEIDALRYELVNVQVHNNLLREEVERLRCLVTHMSTMKGAMEVVGVDVNVTKSRLGKYFNGEE